MSGLWILGHFLWLSIEDMRKGQLSLAVIAELGMTGLIRLIWSHGTAAWLPGIFLLWAGYISKERIGYGDGWLILALGAWLSAEELFRLLGLGFLYCVVFGVVSGKQELPFVPFLTAAYITGGGL